MGRQILQIARTNCAGAIWRLHAIINKYTGHRCRTATISAVTNGRRYPTDIHVQNIAEMTRTIEAADVIHFHNWMDSDSREMRPFARSLAMKRKVIQYHTEPALLQQAHRQNVVTRTDIPSLVIAQKHARFYPQSIVVPNVMDLNDEMLTPSDRVFKSGQKLKVIYTPSDLKTYPSYEGTCAGKGYQEMMPTLQKLQREGVIELTVVTNMAWEELMPLKRTYDVCIDELVTGGYHLCSLESLSQGLVTLGWLDLQTQDVIHKVVGKHTPLPWFNVRLPDLEGALRTLAADPALVARYKATGRQWMEANWRPERMVEHYIRAYRFESAPVLTAPVAPPPVKQQILVQFTANNAVSSAYDHPPLILPTLRTLEGAWSDAPVVVWGNGPTAVDAARDKPWRPGTRHIGTNAAAKLPIEFSAYCIGDVRFLAVPTKRSIAESAPGVRIYQSQLRPHLGDGLGINYVKTIGRDGFSSDVNRGVYHGYSVAYLALQVAVWTGAKEILLAGCGHNYAVSQPRFYAEDKAQQYDNNLQAILANYRALVPILARAGITLRTIGPSRLQDAGIPMVG